MRRTDLDAMRVIAIILVLLNHLPAYTMYYKGEGICEMGYLLTALITRINVPLFAMVSGALLLHKEESYGEIWRKRICRMLMAIVVFQMALYLQRCLANSSAPKVWEFLQLTLEGNHTGYVPYWFLYAYVGFLLALPILRRFARRMTRADFWYLFGLHALLFTVPSIANFVLHETGIGSFKLSNLVMMPMACSVLLFFPLMGHYLDSINIRNITARQWALLLSATTLGLLIAGGLTWWQGTHEKFTQDYLNVCAYLTTISAFLLIKRLWTPKATARKEGDSNGCSADSAVNGCNVDSTINCCSADSAANEGKASSRGRIIRLLGTLCFGIYLLDNNLKEGLWTPFAKALQPTCSKYVISLLWIAMSIVVCGIATWLLKRLPWFKKML